MKSRFFTFLILGLSSVVLADDGWVGNGGNPSTLNGKHATVRMADEVVRIHVGKNDTKVDCLFHFVNEGPATTVRMGFPDQDSSREEGPKSVFSRYESWVDGKKTRCKFEGSEDLGFWQTKSVSFGAHQTRTVRDRYTVTTGSGYQGGKSYMHYANYVLHTGNTWKGSIGSVKVVVDFDGSFFRAESAVPSSVLESKIHPKDGNYDDQFAKTLDSVLSRNKHTVFWAGFAKPSLKGGVLTFTAKNLQPAEGDDIALVFGPFHAG